MSKTQTYMDNMQDSIMLAMQRLAAFNKHRDILLNVPDADVVQFTLTGNINNKVVTLTRTAPGGWWVSTTDATHRSWDDAVSRYVMNQSPDVLVSVSMGSIQ